MSDFDEDYSQDEEIPIIDDDDDDDDDMISDNYEQLEEKHETALVKSEKEEASPIPNENAFSMDHSDDLGPERVDTRKSYNINDNF